ncbi:hypothetical protein SAMN05660772_00997 [Pasteurella testudinis DSM 23072]|uniref:Uncharacterized protein n=1 Tax=Pasteurella testudinis DSM 23072 TaxID=1122938 RepID=A0A1W1V3B8_9PAST|nr:terminase [Pasteurella testudinis]SMB87531.1 hypothetical protein SAMN05660772_00997 [Pasteurella testudinis DSM 23072]SUB50522.1 Uncharacterised protein [Pasteurella testudinis]
MNADRKVTILIPTDYGKSESNFYHLYFILTDPCFNGETGQEDSVLSVSCSSIKQGKVFDNTCVLKAGEHEFIRHDSFVFYRHLRIDSASIINQKVAQGLFITKTMISDDIYRRILKGVLVSRNTERQYIRFLKSAIKQGACFDVFNVPEK